MIDGFNAMGMQLAGIVENTNQTFPFIRPPKFELYAYELRKATGVELLT